MEKQNQMQLESRTITLGVNNGNGLSKFSEAEAHRKIEDFINNEDAAVREFGFIMREGSVGRGTTEYSLERAKGVNAIKK